MHFFEMTRRDTPRLKTANTYRAISPVVAGKYRTETVVAHAGRARIDYS
jgi:hypothetical protein